MNTFDHLVSTGNHHQQQQQQQHRQQLLVPPITISIPPAVKTCDGSQTEPLNLKMGETTVFMVSPKKDAKFSYIKKSDIKMILEGGKKRPHYSPVQKKKKKKKLEELQPVTIDGTRIRRNREGFFLTGF